jgi:hypothetical protein
MQNTHVENKLLGVYRVQTINVESIQPRNHKQSRANNMQSETQTPHATHSPSGEMDSRLEIENID